MYELFQGTKYVPMSKFERVCMELSSALRREQKAQLLLQEQSNQLMELTSRLDLCASDGVHKDNDLVQVQEVSRFQGSSSGNKRQMYNTKTECFEKPDICQFASNNTLRFLHNQNHCRH